MFWSQVKNKSCMHSEYKSHRKLQQVLWDHPKNRKRRNVLPSHQRLIRQAAIFSAQTHQLVILVLGALAMHKGPSQSATGTGTRRWRESFKEIPLERETKTHRKVSPEQVTTVFSLMLLMDLQPSNMDQHRKNTRLIKEIEICRLNFWPAPFLASPGASAGKAFPLSPKSKPSNMHNAEIHRHSNINLCWGDIRKPYRQHRKLSCC